MCYPMIIMAVGAVVSAAGAIQQGKAAQQKGQADANMSRQQAQDAKERGEIESAMVRRKGEQKKGLQMAQMAASGLDITAEGTTMDLLADTEMFTELDAITATNNASKQSFLHEYSARNSIASGNAAKQAGYMSAAGTLLSTAGSMGSSFNSFQADPNNAAIPAPFANARGAKGFGDFMLS
jgi:hypothetical protein